MSKTTFQFTIPMFDAVKPALEAVSDAYEKDNPGAITCQLSKTASGDVLINGTFLEPEWAAKVRAVLVERLKEKK